MLCIYTVYTDRLCHAGIYNGTPLRDSVVFDYAHSKSNYLCDPDNNWFQSQDMSNLGERLTSMNLAEDPQAAQAAVQQLVTVGADESAAVQQPAGVVPAAVSVSPRVRQQLPRNPCGPLCCWSW
jgi:hypothetical protein